MQNPYKTKLPRNSRSKLLLFSILAFLVLAGPAITLQGPGKALMAGTSNSPSLSNSSPAPSQSGVVDTANCSKVMGQAYDDYDENAFVSVDIYINDVFKATITANRCTPIGQGANCHGFTYFIPSALKNGQELKVNVKLTATQEDLVGSPVYIRCGAMLFPTLPGTVTSVSGQGQTWEQAIQFASTESGKITHIKFWKVAEESGSHVGRIWSNTGTLLRTAPFPYTPPGTSGWQIAQLSSPLPITAGTKYRVSYNVNYYGGKILSGLTSPYINEPLIAWKGFYGTPSGTFPNTSSLSNFLADVVLNVPE